MYGEGGCTCCCSGLVEGMLGEMCTTKCVYVYNKKSCVLLLLLALVPPPVSLTIIASGGHDKHWSTIYIYCACMFLGN